MQKRELCPPVLEGSADKTINNIKAAILIVVFTASPFGKSFITLVWYYSDWLRNQLRSYSWTGELVKVAARAAWVCVAKNVGLRLMEIGSSPPARLKERWQMRPGLMAHIFHSWFISRARMNTTRLVSNSSASHTDFRHRLSLLPYPTTFHLDRQTKEWTPHLSRKPAQNRASIRPRPLLQESTRSLRPVSRTFARKGIRPRRRRQEPERGVAPLTLGPSSGLWALCTREHIRART